MRHRIRRIDATGVLSMLRQEAIKVSPGTTEAAVATITLVAERLNPNPPKNHWRTGPEITKSASSYLGILVFLPPDNPETGST